MTDKHKKKSQTKNLMRETIYNQSRDFGKSLYKCRNRIRKLKEELREVRNENKRLRKEVKNNGNKNT